MTVKKLIELLGQASADSEVVIASDEEGNSYNKLYSVNINDYNYKDNDELEIGFRKLTPSLKKQGYCSDDVLKDGKPCVVIWP